MFLVTLSSEVGDCKYTSKLSIKFSFDKKKSHRAIIGLKSTSLEYFPIEIQECLIPGGTIQKCNRTNLALKAYYPSDMARAKLRTSSSS
jgi:hypothetical protein